MSEINNIPHPLVGGFKHIPIASELNPQDSYHKRVFIWDLDETIVLIRRLLNGSYARKYHKSSKILRNLGEIIYETIIHFVDEILIGYNVLTHSHVNILEGLFDDYPYYLMVEDFYNSYNLYPKYLLGEFYNEWVKCRSMLEKETDGWLTEAVKCLEIINSRPGQINVLVTGSGLVPAIAKLLLFDLNGFFQIENIYSANNVGKAECFKQIMSIYNTNYTYLVIGDRNEEKEAAKELDIPFWNISEHKHLKRLQHELSVKYF